MSSEAMAQSVTEQGSSEDLGVPQNVTSAQSSPDAMTNTMAGVTASVDRHQVGELFLKVRGHITILNQTSTQVSASYTGNGTIFDTINVNDTGSFTLYPIKWSNGGHYIEGQGGLVTADGKETLRYVFQLTGNTTKEGNSFDRGSWFITTQSPESVFTPLNNTVAFLEAEVDNSDGTFSLISLK